jgi:ATP-dependent Clp protease adaptor protein ClpS
MSTKTGTVEKTSLEVKTPSRWHVVFHNDDFTPMDFVVAVLMEIFNKDTQEALSLTLAVHNTGSASVGLFTKEVAETKQRMVMDAAQAHEHPLLVTIERDAD